MRARASRRVWDPALAVALWMAAAAAAPAAPPPGLPGTPAPPDVVAQLQTEVTAAAHRLERRDAEGVLRHVSEQYRTGPLTKPALRSQLRTLFALHDQMKVRVRIDAVRIVGDQAWIYSTGDLTGHLAWFGRWVPVLSWQREPEVARKEDGVWRLFGHQR